MKRRFRSSVLVFFLFLGHFVLDQGGLLHGQSVELEVVEIHSKRARIFGAGSVCTVLDSSLLRKYSTESLSTLLNDQGPVFIKSYGPSVLSTPSFRGTGAGHTSVLWNGVPLNSMMLGTTDFSLIHTLAADEVRIYHGGNSSVHGNASVGGTIELNSGASSFQGLQVGIRSAIGSFHRYHNGITVRAGKGRFSSHSSAFVFRSRNDFPYINANLPGTPKLNLSHAKSQSWGVIQHLHFETKRGHQLSSGMWYQTAHREIPATLSVPSSMAIQADSTLRLYFSWKKKLKGGHISAMGGYSDEVIDFQDQWVKSISPTKTLNAEVEFRKLLADKIILNTGADVQIGRGRSDNYGSTQSQIRSTLFAGVNWPFHSKWKMCSNVRLLWVPGFKLAPAPSIGIEGKVGKGLLTVKGSFSENYSVPTLNMLFWQPGGNPDLLSETSWNAESGLVLKKKLGKAAYFSAELTVFSSWIKNWIMWMPVSSGFWSPINFKQVWSRGIENSIKYSYSKSDWSTGLNLFWAVNVSTNRRIYDNMSIEAVGKQLTYTPVFQSKARAWVTFKGVELSLINSSTSKRFTSTLNEHHLPSYALLHIHLFKTFEYRAFKFHTGIKFENILNHSYQSVLSRPMPGRSVNFSLNIDFTQKNILKKNEKN